MLEISLIPLTNRTEAYTGLSYKISAYHDD